jgi:hypothetical protein
MKPATPEITYVVGATRSTATSTYANTRPFRPYGQIISSASLLHIELISLVYCNQIGVVEL